LSILRKTVEKIQVSLKPDTNNQYFTWRQIYIFLSQLAHFSNWNEKCIRQKFSRKWCRLWDNVEKYCTARQATYDNMAHAHCMLDT